MKRTAVSLLAVLATVLSARADATVKPGNLTLIDTSATAGAVDLTLSSATHATFTALGAFDEEKATNAGRWLAVKGAHMFVTYHFNEATRVNTVRLYNPSSDMSDTRAPKDWTFEGSNDGETWTVLDTRTDESGWTKREIRTYRFENDTAYAYYKFDCTANNGASDYLALWEIEFYTSDASLPVEVSKGGAGTVSSASATHSDYPASKAFDNNRSDSNGRWLATKAGNMFLVYHFKRATVVNGISIFNGGGWEGAKRAPLDWTFEGSNDGETWTVLDTQIDETGWAFNSSTNLGEERYYAFDNSTAYEYYKFNCTALNGATDYLQIWEIEFYGMEPKPLTLDDKVAMFLDPKGYTNVLEVALDNTGDYQAWFSVDSDGYPAFAAAANGGPDSKIAIVYKITSEGKWWFVQRMYYDGKDEEPYLLNFTSNRAASYENFNVYRLSDGVKQSASTAYSDGEYYIAICDLPDLENHDRLNGIFNYQEEFHMYVLHLNGKVSYALRRVDALPATLELGQTAPFSVMPYDEITGRDFPDLPVVYETNANLSYENGLVRARASGTGSVAGILTVGETIVSNRMTTTIPMPSMHSYQQMGSWEIDTVNSGNNWTISFPVAQLEGLRTGMNFEKPIIKFEYDNPSAAAISSGVNFVLNGQSYSLLGWAAHPAESQSGKWLAFADAIPEVTSLRVSIAPGLHVGRVTVYRYVSGTFLYLR